ncbi:MAG: hypothetical protein LBC12_06190 [Nitrososphaerota archaeon]|jgi:hypothetical protein|nr:hypothetical protein [Nitrososphaerota archaeon]
MSHQKTQLIVSCQTGEIICIAHVGGSEYDFFLYQDSVGCLVSEGFLFQGVGYQGILKLHKNGEVSEKKSKGGVLRVVEKVELVYFL